VVELISLIVLSETAKSPGQRKNTEAIGVRGGARGGDGCHPTGLKIFRANSVFQGKRKVAKNPDW